MLHVQTYSNQTLHRVRKHELEQAVRHYMQTLSVLQQEGFENLSAETLQKLTAHFTEQLRLIENELARRKRPAKTRRASRKAAE